MARREAIRGAFATLVHAASVAGFLVVLSAVVVTAGPLDWAPWRRLGLGWRFWMAIANNGAVVGFAALIGCLALSAGGPHRPPGRYEGIALYAGLNVVTIILMTLVPVVAALY